MHPSGINSRARCVFEDRILKPESGCSGPPPRLTTRNAKAMNTNNAIHPRRPPGRPDETTRRRRNAPAEEKR